MTRVNDAAVAALVESIRSVLPASISPLLTPDTARDKASIAVRELERRGFVLVSITEFDQTVAAAAHGARVDRAARAFSEMAADTRTLLEEVKGMRERAERHLKILRGEAPS